MLYISPQIIIKNRELQFSAVRAQGAGGQHVNKVSSAIHLRFDIHNSSLPEIYKTRLLALNDARISKEGVVIIKAQESRSQQKNKRLAQDRLVTLLKSVARQPRKRIATKINPGIQARRLEHKRKHAQKKYLRGKISGTDFAD